MSRESPRVTAALKAFEGRYPAQIELSLGRIARLLDRLGRPHDRLPPVLHVAGTNGKGSTCAFLRSMLEAAGLSVHVFTSPHLVRFNERIRLAGVIVADDLLVDALARTRAALGEDEITHFEATTAAALLLFSEWPADYLILEVGLGGRFDATNVIGPPALSVITPVDYDHKQFLGDDLASIAGEKAGIIKPGVPAVSAVQAPVAAAVIEAEARRQGAPLTVLGKDDLARMDGPLGLRGAHQVANAALAALALRTVQDSRVTEAAIATGGRTAHWPARLQDLGPGGLSALAVGAALWLDGGHNPHAGRALAAYLAGLPGTTALVTAMLASKDARGFFEAFVALSPHVFTVENAPGHASASPQALADAARAAGLAATACGPLETGLAAAAETGPARILICGSLYLAGEVLLKHGASPD